MDGDWQNRAIKDMMSEGIDLLEAQECFRQWNAAVRRAQDRVLDTMAYAYVQDQLRDEESAFFRRHKTQIEWYNEHKRLMAEDIRHRNEGKSSSAWFVTLNPPKDYSPSELWEGATGYLKKNCPKSVKSWYAVMEQRSEDPNQISGWHLHFIVVYHECRTRSVAMQAMRTVLCKIWTKEDQKVPEFTRNWCVWKHLESHHKKYIEGDKKAEKMLKVQVDKIARQQYGFPDFASGGPEIIFPGEDIVQDGVQKVSTSPTSSEGTSSEEEGVSDNSYVTG